MLFGYPIEATEENWLHDCLEAARYMQIEHPETVKENEEFYQVVPAPPGQGNGQGTSPENVQDNGES